MAVILVVDDEVGIARLLEDVLVDEGHEVVLASNGRHALEQAHRQRPAVVLTDFMMPVMDGIAVIEAFAADPALAGIPIVLMSSMPEATIETRTRRHAAFVRKPFRIYDLVDLINSLLLESPQS